MRDVKVIFLFIIVLLSCSPASKSQYSGHRDLQTIAEEKLGKNFNAEYNAEKTYLLCKENRQGDHANRLFKFIVIKIADHSIVHEGTYKMGYVKWLDNESLEVATSNDPARDDQVSKKIINVTSEQQ
ncbi:MAG: hypothetical protein ACOYXT_21985 [Bacteroidota bacterium]